MSPYHKYHRQGWSALKNEEYWWTDEFLGEALVEVKSVKQRRHTTKLTGTSRQEDPASRLGECELVRWSSNKEYKAKFQWLIKHKLPEWYFLIAYKKELDS